jgi:hypothetical protein
LEWFLEPDKNDTIKFREVLQQADGLGRALRLKGDFFFLGLKQE